MSRDLTGAYLTALADQNLRPAVFFEGEFASGFLRLWTGLGPITWNAQTWTGAGSLLGFGAIEETTAVVASGATITLSGVPTDLVSACIADVRQGMGGKLWLALLTAAGAIVADPVQIFAGRIDVPELTDDMDSCTITISYESRLIDLNRTRTWRYTDQSQKALYAGDRGFEYVTAIQDKDITWGRG